MRDITYKGDAIDDFPLEDKIDRWIVPDQVAFNRSLMWTSIPVVSSDTILLIHAPRNCRRMSPSSCVWTDPLTAMRLTQPIQVSSLRVFNQGHGRSPQ